MVANKQILVPVIFILAGIVIIFAIPTPYEGTLLLYINEQHAIRLVDAVGLVIAVPSWFYLNVYLLRRWVNNRKNS